MSRSRFVFAFVAWAWLAPSLVSSPNKAFAQDDAAEERAASFQATSGAVKEDVAGGPLLVAAYAFVWLAVLGYVFRLGRLQAGTDARLATLEHAVAKAGGEKGSSAS